MALRRPIRLIPTIRDRNVYEKVKSCHTNFLCISSNISNTRDSVSSAYPNTKKRVENTTRSGVFFDGIRGVWMADETLS